MTSQRKLPRVVSLLGSATEIVCALGMERSLVGRSHECDYPESTIALPECTEPKFPTEGTSYQIDQRVRALVQEGLSVYRVFADKLNSLRPDVIITQTQCEICAVSERDVIDAARTIVTSQPEIVTLKTGDLAGLWSDIQLIAVALGIPERGRDLCESLQNRVKTIAEKASHAPRKRVAYVEWIEPLMAGGNWMPELVVLAGAENLLSEPGLHSPVISWEEFCIAKPEVIVVGPCGWGIEKCREEVVILTQRCEWKLLPAVEAGEVYIVDGNHYFNRSGPRLVESLEILAELLHPELFSFGHQDNNFVQYSASV